jgi:hypothetical protein
MTGNSRSLSFTSDAEAQSEPPLALGRAEEEFALAMPPVPVADSEAPLSGFPRPSPSPPKRNSGVYGLAAGASLLWLAGMIAAAFAYRGGLGLFENQGIGLAVLIGLCLAPIGLIFLAVHAVNQGRAFIAEARRSRDYADRMLEPTATAVVETGSAVQMIRAQIEEAASTAVQARTDLVRLRDELTEETAKLAESARVSADSTRALVESLGKERAELTSLTASLDAQAVAISEAIGRHARMVAEASDLAQTQIGEAEAALAARAADLTGRQRCGPRGQRGYLPSGVAARGRHRRCRRPDPGRRGGAGATARSPDRDGPRSSR